MNFRYIARAVACTALLVLPLALTAQDDKLTIHGSMNMAYGKTDGLPYFGLNKDGTSDYRAIALLFGYKISEKDRVVVQLLHRKFGTSPLNAGYPAIEPVWAFYEHRFENGVSLKLGRNPLPRGLFNEIRYIGTLLPLYRVGAVGVYGETLEFVDGAVVRKSFDVGSGWAIDASAFGGGFDLKSQFPTANGNILIQQREENMAGTQVWVNTPITGVKFGGFAASFQPTPYSSVPAATRPKRLTNLMLSGDATFERAFVRGEFSKFKSPDPSFVDVTGYYVQAGVKPHDEVTIAAEYGALDNVVRFPGGGIIPDLPLPASRDLAVGVTWKPSVQIAFKLEGHRYEGYSFDSPVPSVIAPTAPPLIATLAPKSKVNYLIASVAVSF